MADNKPRAELRVDDLGGVKAHGIRWLEHGFTSAMPDEETARQCLIAGELLQLAKRLVKWDKDYPVNCIDGYAGLQALDAIIKDAADLIRKAETRKGESQ